MSQWWGEDEWSSGIWTSWQVIQKLRSLWTFLSDTWHLTRTIQHTHRPAGSPKSTGQWGSTMGAYRDIVPPRLQSGSTEEMLTARIFRKWTCLREKCRSWKSTAVQLSDPGEAVSPPLASVCPSAKYGVELPRPVYWEDGSSLEISKQMKTWRWNDLSTLELRCRHPSSRGDLLASGLISIIRGHLSVTSEESSFQMQVLE